MQQMVDSLQSSMRLLVASVRSPDDIVALASQVLPCLLLPLSPCQLAIAQGCCCTAVEEGMSMLIIQAQRVAAAVHCRIAPC